MVNVIGVLLFIRKTLLLHHCDVYTTIRHVLGTYTDDRRITDDGVIYRFRYSVFSKDLLHQLKQIFPKQIKYSPDNRKIHKKYVVKVRHV